MSTAPSGQDTEISYMCQYCGGFLLRSRDRRGVLHDVACSRCRRRVTVYLGGRQTRVDLTQLRD